MKEWKEKRIPTQSNNKHYSWIVIQVAHHLKAKIWEEEFIGRSQVHGRTGPEEDGEAVVLQDPPP